jgi:hypothetical protein
VRGSVRSRGASVELGAASIHQASTRAITTPRTEPMAASKTSVKRRDADAHGRKEAGAGEGAWVGQGAGEGMPGGWTGVRLAMAPQV